MPLDQQHARREAGDEPVHGQLAAHRLHDHVPRVGHGHAGPGQRADEPQLRGDRPAEPGPPPVVERDLRVEAPRDLVAPSAGVAPACERPREERLEILVVRPGVEHGRDAVPEPGPERERVVVTVGLVHVDRTLGAFEHAADPRRARAGHPRDEDAVHVTRHL